MRSASFSEAVDPAPRDNQAAKRSVSISSNSATSTLIYSFELKALRRDNYRCVVTGWLDSESYLSLDAAALQAYNLNQNPPLRTATKFGYIFSPSANWGFDPNLNDAVEKKISLFLFIICFSSFNVLQKKIRHGYY
jgi:hypothetical protein